MDSNVNELKRKEVIRANYYNVGEDLKLTFVPNWGQFDERLIAMVMKNNDYKMVQMTEQCVIGEDVATNYSNKNVVNPEKLKQLDESLDLQAVVGQYSHTDYIKKGANKGHGMVLFFVDGNAVKYCFSGPKELSYKVISF